MVWWGKISIFHAKNVLLLDKVLTSQIYEAEAGLENSQFSFVSQFIKNYTSPILDDSKTVYDRWIREHKCKEKNMGIAINVVDMGDIEKPLPSTVDWKVPLPKKKFICVLKLRALVHV